MNRLVRSIDADEDDVATDGVCFVGNNNSAGKYCTLLSVLVVWDQNTMDDATHTVLMPHSTDAINSFRFKFSSVLVLVFFSSMVNISVRHHHVLAGIIAK